MDIYLKPGGVCLCHSLSPHLSPSSRFMSLSHLSVLSSFSLGARTQWEEWDGYVRSLGPRGGGAVSWLLDALRTQCDMLERNRVKMLRIQEAAKKVVPVESSVNLPVRLP